MRGEQDFERYVAARWPALVRELAEQGATAAEAHDRAAEALSRCRREWSREHRDGDVDALVGDALAQVWRPRAAATTTELTVLAPPTIDELKDRERTRRRATTRRAVAALVPLLLVAGATTWWTTRDEPEPEPEPQLEEVAVALQTNPAGVVWYADDSLHLAQVVLAVPGVRSLVAVPGGAVYADEQDRVVHVSETGERTQIGQTDRDLAADPARGLVTWLDPDTADGPRLVAWDALDQRRIADPVVADAQRVVAVSGETVFFADAVGTRAWQPGTRQVPNDVVEPARLLAAAATTRAYQVEEGVVRVERSFAGVAFEVAGEGAAISPDGSLVLTRRRGAASGHVLLYDANTGRRVDSGLDDRYEVAAAAQLGPGDRVTYVVGRVRAETAPGFVRSVPSGYLELRTCDLATHRCEALARFPATDSPPLLAA